MVVTSRSDIGDGATRWAESSGSVTFCRRQWTLGCARKWSAASEREPRGRRALPCALMSLPASGRSQPRGSPSSERAYATTPSRSCAASTYRAASSANTAATNAQSRRRRMDWPTDGMTTCLISRSQNGSVSGRRQRWPTPRPSPGGWNPPTRFGIGCMRISQTRTRRARLIYRTDNGSAELAPAARYRAPRDSARHDRLARTWFRLAGRSRGQQSIAGLLGWRITQRLARQQDLTDERVQEGDRQL